MKKTINLYKILKVELGKKGKDWSLIEKALYIYYRTCQEFNYDETYLGGNIYTVVKNLDITKIADRSLVCTTWSHLYKNLADALFKEEDNYGKTVILDEEGHNYINFLTKDNKTLMLDPLSKSEDFLAASCGFDLSIGIGKGIAYFEDMKMDNEKASKMLSKVVDSYSFNYFDYLKLLKEELKKKYHSDNLNTLSDEQLNEIFTYVIKTSNFKNLGLIEANRLIYITLLYLFDVKPVDLGFEKDEHFGNLFKDAFYDLYVPKTSDEVEVYRLTRKGIDNIKYENLGVRKK